MAEMQTRLSGKRIIGDKGYRGAEHIISTVNEFDNAQVAEWKDRVLARHETINQSAKLFEILKQKFRHGVGNHGVVFRAVLCVIHYQIRNGIFTLFDPYL